MSLLEALRTYAVIPNRKEAKRRLLAEWIDKYDGRIMRRGFTGDAENEPYWICSNDYCLRMGTFYDGRKTITMRQLADMCAIDYDKWMPPKKSVENTKRLGKAIHEYEEPKKAQTPDPPTNFLTQIHIGFDGMTTHCVVKDNTGVVARSKAQAVGEDKEHFDQLIGANVALLKLMPKEAWPEFLETLMDIIGIDFQVDFNVNAKLVNADEA